MLKRREERNKHRPELAAILNKYKCTHAQYTQAFESIKRHNPVFFYITKTGKLASSIQEYGGPFTGNTEYNSNYFEGIGFVPITPEQWGRLNDAAYNDIYSVAEVWASILEEIASTRTDGMLSTLTH